MGKVCVSDEYRQFSSHGEIRVHRHGPGKLATKTFIADDNGFAVTNVIIMGQEKCAIFDAQWTRACACRAVAEILEENLELETIYLSHAHPDHYFGADVYKMFFPKARVIAVPEEAAIMKKQWTAKRNEVVPDIGEINYAPEHIPIEIEPITENYFELEGERIEIIPRLMGDYKYNTAVWIPSIKTLCCSDIVFNEAHPFTCEVDEQERAEWIEVLEKLRGYGADVIIPGHTRFGMPFDQSGLDWTRKYLEATEIELKNCKSKGEFFYAMDRRFPNAILKKSNEMNCEVFFGGKKWDWREEEIWENEKK